MRFPALAAVFIEASAPVYGVPRLGAPTLN